MTEETARCVFFGLDELLYQEPVLYAAADD